MENKTHLNLAMKFTRGQEDLKDWFHELLMPYSLGDIIITEIPSFDHSIFVITIPKPTRLDITIQEICDAFDDGNHCISNGSLFYEEETLFITWSNLGHI